MFKSVLSTVSGLAVACFLLMGTGGVAHAQTMSNTHNMHKGHRVTVTGCLQKGDEANEYSIDAHGKKYGLTSTKVDLSEHVGHKVTVHGYMTPESEGKEANENAAGEKDIDVTVTSLKMVSKMCHM